MGLTSARVVRHICQGVRCRYFLRPTRNLEPIRLDALARPWQVGLRISSLQPYATIVATALSSPAMHCAHRAGQSRTVREYNQAISIAYSQHRMLTWNTMGNQWVSRAYHANSVNATAGLGPHLLFCITENTPLRAPVWGEAPEGGIPSCRPPHSQTTSPACTDLAQ
jgi:hypothetical protein